MVFSCEMNMKSYFKANILKHRVNANILPKMWSYCTIQIKNSWGVCTLTAYVHQLFMLLPFCIQSVYTLWKYSFCPTVINFCNDTFVYMLLLQSTWPVELFRGQSLIRFYASHTPLIDLHALYVRLFLYVSFIFLCRDTICKFCYLEQIFYILL